MQLAVNIFVLTFDIRNAKLYLVVLGFILPVGMLTKIVASEEFISK